VADIEALIVSESQGVNIVRPDSNGIPAFGVLQFNGTSTRDEARGAVRLPRLAPHARRSDPHSRPYDL